jgi:hypothetical protein
MIRATSSSVKPRSIWALALMLVCVLVAMRAEGQIFEIREHHGQKITCIRSGLRGFAMPCGTSGNYAYVFVGVVLSAKEISGTERRLQLVPEEVFLGKPVEELTVMTEQGACLPEIQIGDKWLFYLRRDDGNGELLLRYGDPSKPLAGAEEDIAVLRHLVGFTDSGVVKGTATRRYAWDGEGTRFPVPNHMIVAKRKSDGSEYSTATDRTGRYEFEQLPSGSYDLSANTDEEVWAESGTIRVYAKSCSGVDFEMRSAGTISGHISTADGKPFTKHPEVQVHLISGSDDNVNSGYVDEKGFYEVNGLEPGRYLVGIGIMDRAGDPIVKTRVYYPGVRTRDQAVVVELGQAEKRKDVDSQLLDPIKP